MVVTLDIKLHRFSKIYCENDIIRGTIFVQSNTDIKHDGVVLSMDGQVTLQLSSKTVGLFEAFYQSVKPLQLLSYQVDLVKAGKISSGTTEIPFEFPLRARNNRILYETYHGVYINVQYSLKCEVKRSFLIGSSMSKTAEFTVEYGACGGPKNLVTTLPPELLKPAEMKRIEFEMNSEAGSKIGSFRAHGHLDSLTFPISKPFTGEVIIDASEFPLKSIEIQLLRVETCGCTEGYAKDASEIQTIQIGDGNVCKGMPIPIFMIFPRLFCCPTLLTSNFKIEFEANLVVIFANDFFKSENFPLRITRF